MVLTCSDLTATFLTRDFNLKETIFIATGTAEVDLEKIKLQLGVSFKTQTLADGRIVPAIDTVDVIVDIDRNDLKFHIHGNIWTDIASIFEPLFKGAVLDEITSQLNNAMKVTAPTLANQFIAGTEANSMIIPDLWFDWMTEQPFYVTDTSLEFGGRAILYDSEFGETVPTSWPEMPYKVDSEPSGIQVFISEQSVNAALTALLEKHPVDVWLNATMVPASSKLQLNTGALEKVLPGISDYYGANQTVNVRVNVTDVYDATFLEGKETVGLNADWNMKIYVDTVNGTTDLAADLTFTKMIADASILIDGYNVTGNFTKLKVSTITVNSCAFGTISTFKLKMEINVGLAVAAVPINKALSSLVIPETVLGVFTLSDLVIDYYDGFLFGGATPTFIAPTEYTIEKMLGLMIHEAFLTE